MRASPVTVSLALALALAAGTAQAQPRLIVMDRTTANNRLWMIDDFSGNGTIEELGPPAELGVFWGMDNAGAAPAMTTPQGLAYRASDGMIAAGDNGARAIYLMHDANRDGSAQGVGESWVAASVGNASAIVLNVQGVAFDAAGSVYASTSYNPTAGSFSAIVKMTDLSAPPDGDFQDAGEIVTLVGASYMGATSTTVAGDVAIDTRVAPAVGYFKASAGASMLGVHRFETSTGDAAPFITSANASGVALSASLLMTLDAARADAVYFPQTVSGVRQVVRARDLSVPPDKDAQDAGEGAVVWATTEAITALGIASLPDGRVLLTDSARRVLMLTPTGDTFNGYAGTPFAAGAGYSVFYTSSNAPSGSPPSPGSTRQIVAVARPCQANCDDSTASPVLNVADFTCFLSRYAAGDAYANCDASTETPLLNVADFTCFLQRFAAGCP